MASGNTLFMVTTANMTTTRSTTPVNSFPLLPDLYMGSKLVGNMPFRLQSWKHIMKYSVNCWPLDMQDTVDEKALLMKNQKFLRLCLQWIYPLEMPLSW